MMKKMLMAALVLAAFVLVGCARGTNPTAPKATPLPPLTAPVFESEEDVLGLYNEITFDDTLATLTERYGEPTVETDANGDIYFWSKDGSGVAIVFFDNGRMRSKLVNFEDVRQFSKLSQTPNLENVLSLSSDMMVDDVNLYLGAEGIEFIRIAQNSSLSPDFSIGYLWVNEKGEDVKILFNRNGKLDSLSYRLD